MLKNVSMLSLSIAITIPLGLVPKILVPRYLGSESAGLLFFGETFPMLILPFMTLGIPDYISKQIPSRPEHAREIFDSVLRFATIMGIILLAVIAAYMIMMGHDQKTIGITLITSSMQYFTLLCLNIYQPIFVAMSRIRFTSILNIISRALNAMVISILLLAGLGVTWIAVGGLLAQVATLAICRRESRSIQLVGAGFNPLLLKGLLGSSILFFAAGLMGKINGSIDSAFLERFTSFEEIGLYAASSRLSSVFMLFVPIFGQAFFPDLNRLYVHDQSGYRTMMAKSLKVILAVTVPLGVFLTAFGRDAIVLIYGNEFAAAGQMFMSFGPSLIVSYLAVFLGFHSFCTSNGRVTATVVAIGCLVNLFSDLLFIPLGYEKLGHGGGGTGAAAATAVTQCVECMLFLRLSSFKFAGARLLAKMGIALVPCLILVGFDSAWYALPLLHRLLLYAFFIPAFLAATRLVTPQDAKDVAGSLKRLLGRSS
ncbi:MAG: oligosaccharide flippase family protein [Proteobacteria bacterium]|nr:oligosaccharide flippase family protein [Pseudomonadota bacterium]